MKEKPDRKKKKKKKTNYALYYVRPDSTCMVDKERLESFMTEVPFIQKPVHGFAEQTCGLVSIQQELPSVNALPLACIH